MEIHWCICGQRATELHHIVFRSKVKALENCKLNHIYLCPNCHRGTAGVHGRDGNYLDTRLKLQFQNKLEIMLDKEQLTKVEINQVLKISENSLNKLLKAVKVQRNKYSREDVIRQCMGGKLILEGDMNVLHR